jgi:hypothetical protein
MSVDCTSSSQNQYFNQTEIPTTPPPCAPLKPRSTRNHRHRNLQGTRPKELNINKLTTLATKVIQQQNGLQAHFKKHIPRGPSPLCQEQMTQAKIAVGTSE